MKEPITMKLSTDEAIILQQISETGEEDVVSLAQTFGMKRKHIMSSLERLRKKGLISIQRTADDWWVHMSSKGKELARYVWPESVVMYRV
jgi:DNA-binding MarR family transcriptional regulator